jgi:hypothetical protein
MTIELPTHRTTRGVPRLEAAKYREESPFSYQGETQDWGGRRWSIEIEFTRVLEKQGRALSAFFSRILDTTNHFIYRGRDFANPGATDTVEVVGGGQTGKTLNTTGWTQALNAGDFFSLGTGSSTRLYQLTEDVSFDGSGNATLSFVPALRIPSVADELVEIESPGLLLNLEEFPNLEVGITQVYSFSLEAKELL